MENVLGQVREVITAQRKRMSDIEILGLNRIVATTNTNLNWAKRLLKQERRKVRKMARMTRDWTNAREAHKASYWLHDNNRYGLQYAVAELEMDLKTLKSRMNPLAAEYSAHPWNIDVEVYIYNESDATKATDISDAEVDAYAEAVKKCLRGEFCIETGTPGDRGFSFYADAADEDKLADLLNGLEKRGCIIEYPDWDYVNCTGNAE